MCVIGTPNWGAAADMRGAEAGPEAKGADGADELKAVSAGMEDAGRPPEPGNAA